MSSQQKDESYSKLLKAAVYGANDGIITTFAVVAGVAGASLSSRIVLVLGIANLIADGLSMAAGDYLGERSEQTYLRRHRDHYHLKGIWHTGAITFVSFVLAGSVPLLPYAVFALTSYEPLAQQQLYLSCVAAAIALFTVGSLRTPFTRGSWIRNGLEMLSIGLLASAVAFMIGLAVEQWLLP
jgi:vacuolar iron transporter family protein